MKSVYLAGLISTECPESLQWRIDAEKMLQDKFTVLTPMRGKSDLKGASKDGGLNHPMLTSKDIIKRDYGDISESDLILVNLNNYGSKRPLVGTMFELAWAWEKKMPVVAFVEEAAADGEAARIKLAAGVSENAYLMRNHPFIVDVVSHYFPKMEGAVDFIKRELA